MSIQRPAVAQPEADLHQYFTQGPRVLRGSWTLTTFAGTCLGFLVPALVATVAVGFHPAASLLLMLLAGAVGGAVLGVAQSLVLGRELLGFSRGAWTSATAVGASLAWSAGMLPGVLPGGWTDWSPLLTVPLGLVLICAVLLPIGYAQSLVLGRHVVRARTWVAANVLAWAAGLGLVLGVCAPLRGEGRPALLVMAAGALAGAAAALTVAFLTALWLVRLVCPPPGRRPASRRPVGVPQDEWTALARSTDEYRLFDPTALDHLPGPVQRWLRHAVTPGASLLTGVETEANGHIRLAGSWRPFSARQRSTLNGGYLWSGRSRVLGLTAVGCDRYTRDQGQLRWRLPGRLRLMREAGEEATRSAAARHALELVATTPAVALDPSVRWQEVDHDHATAHLRVDDEDQAVTVTVDPSGRLRQVEVDRWGRPPRSPFAPYRYGALLGEERSFDGYLVPTEVVAGWHVGTDQWDEGSMLRYRIVRCSFH